MANEEQLSILKQGVEVWNKWRKANPKVEIDLTGANLGGADLRGALFKLAILKDADLAVADLSEANLASADLRGAILIGAHLTGANLTGANLGRAILIDANLTAANLMRARLIDADLRDANLERANLIAAYLLGASLWRTNLKHANLEYADLSGAILVDVDLTGANLTETFLTWAFRGDEAEFRRKMQERDVEYPSVFHAAPQDEVSFTAIYPREGKVETWHTLLVYTHLASVIEEVRRDATHFKDQIPGRKEITSDSSTPIARGTEITIIPSCDGVFFNPERSVVKWLEDYHRADFRFQADQSLTNDAAKGQIDIFVGPIIVGTLKFAMLVNETDAQTAGDHEERCIMYHEEDIFMSYSHKDFDVVLACMKAYKALGFNVLIDIDTLKAGQVWNKELMKMIDNATIFQLFWSQNSSQSKYCRQEWEHALKRNEEGFIRPVYWEIPMPDPPEELGKFHFDYVQF